MDKENKEFVAIIVISIIVGLGVCLWVALTTPSCEVVRAQSQYSASYGGNNQPVQGVSIKIDYANPSKLKQSFFAEKTTDENGLATFDCLITGTTYIVTAEYKGVTKSATLDYHGESDLLVSINPNKPKIYDIKFVQPLPV